jgi:hypothetical protein
VQLPYDFGRKMGEKFLWATQVAATGTGPTPLRVCAVLISGYDTKLGRGDRKEKNVTDLSRQPKDKNYNLITVLYQSSNNVESLKTYIQDAEQEGDQELVEFFNGILENNLRAAQRAKEMLVPRFQGEQE